MAQHTGMRQHPGRSTAGAAVFATVGLFLLASPLARGDAPTATADALPPAEAA